MISIVICSVKPELLAAVTRNIADTIDTSYELIVVDNREAGRGLCSVYNEGARRAVHEVVCFMHEDVEFMEAGWGRNVIAHFSADPTLGAIGLAGARYKSSAPSGWMTAGGGDAHCIRVHQRHRNGRENYFFHRPENDDAPRQEVCTLDGVWICARRHVALEIGFDERLPPFHFYDIDFALRVSEKYRVAVIYDVCLRHFSEGHFDATWMRAALQYQALRHNRGPRLVNTPYLALHKSLERRGVRFWMKFLRKAKTPLSLRWEWVRASGALAYPQLWWLVAKFLFWYPIKFR